MVLFFWFESWSTYNFFEFKEWGKFQNLFNFSKWLLLCPNTSYKAIHLFYLIWYPYLVLLKYVFGFITAHRVLLNLMYMSPYCITWMHSWLWLNDILWYLVGLVSLRYPSKVFSGNLDCFFFFSHIKRRVSLSREN